MDTAREERNFPFGNYVLVNNKHEHIGERYIYKGIFNIKMLKRNLNAHPEFKINAKMYYGLDEVEDYVKSISTDWPNGDTTKQMELKDGTRPRVYLVEQNWTLNSGITGQGRNGNETIPLSRATAKQLGALYELDPGKDDMYIDKVIANLPNYQDTSFEPEKYETFCWSCKTAIELTTETKCSVCNYAIRCQCGQCACDKPGNEHLKKNHY